MSKALLRDSIRVTFGSQIKVPKVFLRGKKPLKVPVRHRNKNAIPDRYRSGTVEFVINTDEGQIDGTFKGITVPVLRVTRMRSAS